MTVNKLLPDTCHCIIQFTPPFDMRLAVLQVQCRTHDTVQETLTHNASFIAKSRTQARTEKDKTQFQRR